jgi:hypothetical protein
MTVADVSSKHRGIYWNIPRVSRTAGNKHRQDGDDVFIKDHPHCLQCCYRPFLRLVERNVDTLEQYVQRFDDKNHCLRRVEGS